MEDFAELLKYTIPSAITFAAAFLVMIRFTKSEEQRNIAELRKEQMNTTLPLRLQAYERLTLFLERINISGLVVRTHKNGMSAKLMHAELINTIRYEYEHNLSQQLYVSSQSWDAVVKAKEETTKLINVVASQFENKKNASGLDLSASLLGALTKIEVNPSKVALQVLKKDVKSLF